MSSIENSTMSRTSKLTSDGTDSNQTTLSYSNTTNNGFGSTLLSNTTDFESTNASLTDITSTLLSSSTLTETDLEKSRNVTRDLLLKKQLLHDVQKLKIELSQKDLLIDTLKAENLNQVDDLEEQLSDVLHQKQLIITKYETQLKLSRDETDKQIKTLKKKYEESLKYCHYYEDRYKEITNKLDSATENYEYKELTEEEYSKIRERPEEELKPSDIFSVKVYERIRPMSVQVETLMQRIELLTSDLNDREEELENQRRDLEEEGKVRAELDIRSQRFQVQIEDLRAQLSQKSYRNVNFDTIQSERDSLERKIVDYEKTCTVYKTELESKSGQMETLRNQLLEQNQTVALLRQDKEYLSKQLNELTPRHHVLEERFDQTARQLDEVKRSREELYEKYLHSREHYKREYEEQMKRELEELSTKTSNEMIRIKESTTEMYERENRNLRDTKNAAVLEQERLSVNEKETQQRYNNLIGEFRQLQISSDSKLATCQNDLKLKSFELDRINIIHEEALNNVKQMGLQNETLSKKLEALSKEYYVLKGSTDKKQTEIEGRNNELQSKLTIYEKLEQELDDVVMQAAEMVNEDDSERVLFAYGYGANVPSTAKRRMQQSVQLARRVLQLERTNTSFRNDIKRETQKREQLAEELKNTTSLLNEAQQPYNYLIDSIRTRDEQSKTLKNTIATLEDDIRILKDENKDLKTTNNQMTSDLERLLSQREEMNVLKKVVIGLKSSQADESFRKVGKTSTVVYGAHSNTRSTMHKNDLESTSTAKPFIFTSSQPPSWYNKLKQQNARIGSIGKTK